MQRSIFNIAFAAASVLAAASVHAAGFPACGEFSAADEVQTPSSAVASSAAPVWTASVSDRAASLRANGEVVATDAAPAPVALTRQVVREEGRIAMRAHKTPVGDASI